MTKIKIVEQTTGLKLTKSSVPEQVKTYFQKVFELKKSGKEFPINLDEVWPLVYSRKEEAVRALKSDFVEVEDYKVLLRQNAEQKKQGGHNRAEYWLSTSCLEYFIAKKVKPVFDVYRQVFHRTIEGKQNRQLYVKGRNNRVTYQQVIAILADIAKIEDSTLRKSLVKSFNDQKDLRFNFKQVVDVMVLVCEIENEELRKSLSNKITGGL